jgi:hypothetical protein
MWERIIGNFSVGREWVAVHVETDAIFWGRPITMRTRITIQRKM